MSEAALAALAGLGHLVQQAEAGETYLLVARATTLDQLNRGQSFREHIAGILETMRAEDELTVLRPIVADAARRARAIVDAVGYRMTLEDLELFDQFVDAWPEWQPMLAPVLSGPELGRPQLTVVR